MKPSSVVVAATLVFYMKCLLCRAAQHHNRQQDLTDTEGFSNDSPFNVEPKVDESLRIKVGTPITLKCANQHGDHIVWEYKECELLYKGIVCDLQDVADAKAGWKKRGSRQRFEIDALKKSHSGLYRCVEKGVVKKSVIIEVVGAESYEGPPPQVQSLLTSNITGQLNMEFTIQCNITSIIPPKVIWFKKCFGSKCDIQYDDICYCPLNVTDSSFNIGNTYISKMNIFNAREIDSGLYACLAVTEYGKDYKYVTIEVPDGNVRGGGKRTLPLLFLVPLALVVGPLGIWICYSKRKKRRKAVQMQQLQQQSLLLGIPSGSRR